MAVVASSDLEFITRHRAVWAARPELRTVYRTWFEELRRTVEGRGPVVEVGSGPGFFKEVWPGLVATDVVVTGALDVACDATALPFASGSVGGIVGIDVLHHLARPLAFLAEAGRVLRDGGRLALVEPWVSPFSFVLYRFFHHEDCRFGVDLEVPFARARKNAFDGNQAIPTQIVRSGAATVGPLRLARAEPSVALPYLATCGFQRARPVSETRMRLARAGERLLGRCRRMFATRVILVWDRGAA